MSKAVERLWQTVIGAKRRAKKRLEAELAARRGELAALRVEEAGRLAEALAAREVLQACERDIEGLLTSAEPVRARRFLETGTRRDVLEEKRDAAEAALTRASEAVAAQEGRVRETTRRLARIDPQIDMCEARLDRLRQARELAEANEADDEAAEAIGALRARQARLAA